MSSPLLTGNKAEMARALGVSTVTLSDYLVRWPLFPVIERGTNGREYVFDIEAGVAFMQAVRASEQAEADGKAALLDQMRIPGIDPTDVPEITFGDQLKMMRIRAMQREEQVEAGFLVRTDQVRPIITGAVVRLRRAIDATIEQFVRTHALSDAALRDMQAQFRATLTAFADDTASFHADHPPEPTLAL